MCPYMMRVLVCLFLIILLSCGCVSRNDDACAACVAATCSKKNSSALYLIIDFYLPEVVHESNGDIFISSLLLMDDLGVYKACETMSLPCAAWNGACFLSGSRHSFRRQCFDMNNALPSENMLLKICYSYCHGVADGEWHIVDVVLRLPLRKVVLKDYGSNYDYYLIGRDEALLFAINCIFWPVFRKPSFIM